MTCCQVLGLIVCVGLVSGIYYYYKTYRGSESKGGRTGGINKGDKP